MNPPEDESSEHSPDVLTHEYLQSRLASIEHLTQQIPAAIWVTDTELRLLDGFGARLGDAFNVDYYRGMHLTDILSDIAGSGDSLVAHLDALRGDTSHFLIEFGGRSLEVTVEPRCSPDGSIAGCTGYAFDVSRRLAAETALRASEERFELVARAANDVLWDWDIAQNTIWWSEGVREVFGHELPGRDTSYEWYELLVHPDDRARVMRTIEEAIRSGAGHWSAEYRFRRADGTYADVFDRGLVRRDRDGNAVRMAGGLQDITARKQLESDLYRQSFEDQLSGLPNRALFLNRLQHALDVHEVRRNGLAVLFLDVDAFKAINDSLGHPAGDSVISNMARRLEAQVPRESTLARLGGDEFAVLQEDLPDTTDAIALATRLLAALRKPWNVNGRALQITASIGIAFIGAGEDLDAAEILRRADAAMYRAKERGKNRYAFYEPSLDYEAFTHFEVELGLRSAIENGQLMLQFQPEVDLDSGRIEGMEALVRWQHPERGLLAPSEFIPIAEKTDLILAIDDWVFHEVCRQTSAWLRLLASRPNFTIGVNVSARQFARPGLADRMAGILEHYGVLPKHLLLEITETATTFDIDAAVEQMRALRQLGVRLAIDDFGTGFASLTYLRRFPIDVLKIDRSFIEDVKEDAAARTIVRGLTTLAQLLSLSVTAEGIETAEQLCEVAALGCHRGQGFYFGHPVGVEEATRLIRHGLPQVGGIDRGDLRSAG